MAKIFHESFIVHSFPKIELKLNDNKEWQKIPVGIQTGWNKLKESSIKSNDKAFGLLTGEKSNVLVLDFDDMNIYNEYIVKYPELDNCPKVSTRKGFHIYFKWDSKYTQLPSKVGKIDIQGNGKQVFYVGTSYMTETGDTFTYTWANKINTLMYLPNDLFLELKGQKITKASTTKKINEIHINNVFIECNNDMWKDIINNIDIKFIDNYKSWFQIVNSLHALGKELNDIPHYKEVARNLSMKSKKYDKTHKEFEKMWEYCGKYNYTPASIRHFSRESNEEMYLKICRVGTAHNSEYVLFDEKLLSKYFLECFGDNLICNYGKIYVFHKGIWCEDNRGSIIQHYLRIEIDKLYINILQVLNDELNACDDKEGKTQILKQINMAADTLRSIGNQKIKNIYGLISNELFAMNLDKDIFDTNENYFVFTNKCYDLKQNKWVKVNKLDYILTTSGKDYKEPTETQIDKIKQLFSDIFPNKEYRKCYISILKTGLLGKRIEKFIVATGGGRNGKGVLNDFYKFLLGDYYGILHLSLLTKEIKSGANTELRSIHRKRFLKATEPDSNSTEKLRMSNIKALTGETNFKARGLYENNFDIQIDATFIMECNKLPFITMDGNEAEKQRMVIVPFETTFTSSEEDVKNFKDYKLADNTLKNNDFWEEHYSSLFNYICDECKECDVYIPDICQQLALKWMLSKDDFVGWFYENFDEDPDGIVSIKEIYKTFKNSNFFLSLPKAQQRQNNEKAFKESIKSKFKNLFIPSNTKINEKERITKDSIKGYIPRCECDSDDD
jgi:hypothetical protein